MVVADGAEKEGRHGVDKELDEGDKKGKRQQALPADDDVGGKGGQREGRVGEGRGGGGC